MLLQTQIRRVGPQCLHVLSSSVNAHVMTIVRVHDRSVHVLISPVTVPLASASPDGHQF